MGRRNRVDLRFLTFCNCHRNIVALVVRVERLKQRDKEHISDSDITHTEKAWSAMEGGH